MVALTERLLCVVEADAGRLEPNDSPRGESIFVTGSPKIYHEARDGAPICIALKPFGFFPIVGRIKIDDPQNS